MFARLRACVTVVAAVMVVAPAGVSADASAGADLRLVSAAIVDAVRQRMAPTAVVVTVDAITDISFAADMRSVTAHVSPYARIGEYLPASCRSSNRTSGFRSRPTRSTSVAARPTS